MWKGMLVRALELPFCCAKLCRQCQNCIAQSISGYSDLYSSLQGHSRKLLSAFFGKNLWPSCEIYAITLRLVRIAYIFDVNVNFLDLNRYASILWFIICNIVV